MDAHANLVPQIPGVARGESAAVDQVEYAGSRREPALAIFSRPWLPFNRDCLVQRRDKRMLGPAWLGSWRGTMDGWRRIGRRAVFRRRGDCRGAGELRLQQPIRGNIEEARLLCRALHYLPGASFLLWRYPQLLKCCLKARIGRKLHTFKFFVQSLVQRNLQERPYTRCLLVTRNSLMPQRQELNFAVSGYANKAENPGRAYFLAKRARLCPAMAKVTRKARHVSVAACALVNCASNLYRIVLR